MKPDWDDFREMNRTAIAALPACGQEAYLWRPRDEDEAMEILR